MSSKCTLSKLKQSRYRIILIVSSDASIDVQELHELQKRICYSHNVLWYYYNVNRAKYETYMMMYIVCYVIFALLINDVELCLPHWSLADIATLVKCMFETRKLDSAKPNSMSRRRSGGDIKNSHIGYGNFPRILFWVLESLICSVVVFLAPLLADIISLTWQFT